MSSERGLVISCPIKVKNGALHIISGGLDLQDIRFALLFWDKLDYPSNNLFTAGLDRDSQFLVDRSILRRTRVRVSGSGQMEAMYLEAHLQAFHALDQAEPGVWSLGTSTNSISFPDRDFETGRGALVRLHQAIPVPDKEVPLHDILEFRAKRRPELLALRYHLERIYQKVISAGDGELALNTEIGTLELAIADHIKASKESGLRFRGMSFDAGLNLVAGGVAVAESLAKGLPLLDALMDGVTAVISIGPTTSLKGARATGTPYRYISAYHQEVF